MPGGQWGHFCSRLSAGWPWAQPWGLALGLFHIPHSPCTDVHHIFLMLRYKGFCKHVQASAHVLASCFLLAKANHRDALFLLLHCQAESEELRTSMQSTTALYSLLLGHPTSMHPFFLLKQKTLMSPL